MSPFKDMGPTIHKTSMTTLKDALHNETGLKQFLFVFKARGRPIRGQKNKFGFYQSPTCHGVTTFYGIAKSSFMTKIWCVKVRGY